jgi:pimeloyl-ACP methyl ester carboxylesterase
VTTKRYVVFSHGKDSEPWSRKITALAETARSEGYEVESVDYRPRPGSKDADTPAERMSRLADVCKGLHGELVLVGSSYGGYVSIASAPTLHARGLFLMAPAVYMPQLPELRPRLLDCPTTIVHGWRDDVVPYDNSVRFAREYLATLHLVDDDHRLHTQLRFIKYLFEHFLISLDIPAALT